MNTMVVDCAEARTEFLCWTAAFRRRNGKNPGMSDIRADSDALRWFDTMKSRTKKREERRSVVARPREDQQNSSAADKAAFSHRLAAKLASKRKLQLAQGQDDSSRKQKCAHQFDAAQFGTAESITRNFVVATRNTIRPRSHSTHINVGVDIPGHTHCQVHSDMATRMGPIL